MNEKQQKKNQRLIVLLFSMSLLPLSLAWYFKTHPQLLQATTNHGTLIRPPLTTELSEFNGFDSFSRDNTKELAAHWVLLHIVPSTCAAVCLEMLHKSQQLVLMMGKDLLRIRRAVLLLTPVEAKTAEQWWRDDSRLLRFQATPSLLSKLQALPPLPPEGLVLLMDPLGNLMMYYKPDFDAYQVRDDLRKLLTVSQIG